MFDNPAWEVCERVAGGSRRHWGKVMEWFTQKTSIAGVQIPNWGFVLGAIIIILLIFTFGY